MYTHTYMLSLRVSSTFSISALFAMRYFAEIRFWKISHCILRFLRGTDIHHNEGGYRYTVLTDIYHEDI
jgi:hypothetical protein